MNNIFHNIDVTIEEEFLVSFEDAGDLLDLSYKMADGETVADLIVRQHQCNVVLPLTYIRRRRTWLVMSSQKNSMTIGIALNDTKLNLSW